MAEVKAPGVPGWVGMALWILGSFILIADGLFSLFGGAEAVKMSTDAGFPASAAPIIGASALISGILYAIPRTSVLGAIFATGFFGGAICTHVRLGEYGVPEQFMSLLFAAICWGGLYFRDARVRVLLPLVQKA